MFLIYSILHSNHDNLSVLFFPGRGGLGPCQSPLTRLIEVPRYIHKLKRLGVKRVDISFLFLWMKFNKYIPILLY